MKIYTCLKEKYIEKITAWIKNMHEDRQLLHMIIDTETDKITFQFINDDYIHGNEDSFEITFPLFITQVKE